MGIAVRRSRIEPRCDISHSAARFNEWAESSEDMMKGEVERLRAAQAKEVMPLIGPLLDAWEMLDNGTRSDLEIDAPNLCEALDRIATAVAA